MRHSTWLLVPLLAVQPLEALVPPKTMDLEVVVVDEEGRPWERANVFAGGVLQGRLRWGGCAGDRTQQEARTDASGGARFELEIEDAEWVRVAASVMVDRAEWEWEWGPGPQQWIEAKPGPTTVRLVMPRDTPLRSALVSNPERSKDHLTIVRADGTSERRPVGGGGPGFVALDETGEAGQEGKAQTAEHAELPQRRIGGRVVARGEPLDHGEVRGPVGNAPIALDGWFLLEAVPDSGVRLCVELEGRSACRWAPAGGDLEVEFDLSPVRISGRLVGENWADVRALELKVNPISSAAGSQPAILLGPDGAFESPDLPAGCYLIWGAWPVPGYLGVGALVRLEPGEHAQLTLDADNPSVEGIGHLLWAERGCQEIEVRVLR